jgi:hypothetical protein
MAVTRVGTWLWMCRSKLDHPTPALLTVTLLTRTPPTQTLPTQTLPTVVRPTATGTAAQATAIEAQALQLLRRAMTGVTARAKDRLDIASEIDAGGRLGGRDAAREAQSRGDGDDAHRHWRRDYTQARPGRDSVQ